MTHADDCVWMPRALAAEAEVEAMKSGAKEYACLRTGHVASAAANKIAALESALSRARDEAIEECASLCEAEAESAVSRFSSEDDEDGDGVFVQNELLDQAGRLRAMKGGTK